MKVLSPDFLHLESNSAKCSELFKTWHPADHLSIYLLTPYGLALGYDALNGMDINGRKLDVKIASPKSNRPAKKTTTTPAKKFEKKPFGDKKPFKKFDKPRSDSGEKKVIKPNPVERDSEGKVIRRTEQ